MPVRNSMDRRVVAWAEVSIVFLALYLGVPLAGLTIDRGLGLSHRRAVRPPSSQRVAAERLTRPPL